MTAPAEPRSSPKSVVLAVAEQGPLVVVVDRGTGPLATVAFVLGVLALVFGGFGAATLALTATGANGPAAGGSARSSCSSALALRRRGARRRRPDPERRARPLSGYRPVATFDRARRLYVDADGVVVAPLEQVRFQSRTQLTSSSPSWSR